jgi:hypothetical protein
LLVEASMSDANHTGPFTAIEEEFFRAGALMSEAASAADSFSDLDEARRPRSLLRRLFARKTTER